jgi:hypothetical protein
LKFLHHATVNHRRRVTFSTVATYGKEGFGSPAGDASEVAMEMHQVRYFLAVATELNFTRASETCHVSQPSLTRAIKLLEEELADRYFIASAPTLT